MVRACRARYHGIQAFSRFIHPYWGDPKEEVVRGTHIRVLFLIVLFTPGFETYGLFTRG